MNILITILISLACAAGGWFGGSLYTAHHDESLPPKTVVQNITTTQHVETKSTSIQQADQSQSTIILQDNKTNFRYVSIQDDGRTNRTYFFSSKTNIQHKTNK